jgi:uncharacterized paraquat-inducible protein A
VFEGVRSAVGSLVAAFPRTGVHEHSDGDDSETEDTTPSDASGERVTSGLYHCSTCETVYIAAEKRECSQCRKPVERVRKTTKTE